MSAVSVVMAVYNGERYLMEQLASVLGQLHPGDELIVIDDASRDGSRAMLDGIVSPLLQVHTSDCNRGVIGTFEAGMRLARHDVVFFCDQDDIWLPGKRDAFVAVFDAEPAVALVISDAEIIDEVGTVVAPSFMATRGGFRGSRWQTLKSNRYIGCALAVRRAVLDLALPVPKTVPMHDMWVGALVGSVGTVRYLPTPFLQYRRHGANASPAGRQSLPRMLRWRIALACALGLRLLRWHAGWHGADRPGDARS